MSPEQVKDWLVEKQISARWTVTDDGLSRIMTGLAGKSFLITFHPSTEGGSTRDMFRFLSMWTGFETHGWSLQRVNQWNKEHRWVKAYLDEGGLNLEMDVCLASDALDRVLLERNLYAWQLGLEILQEQLRDRI